MRFFFKDRGANRAEAWIEEWVWGDWEVVCDAYLIIGDKILVDDITTYPQFRRQGYATRLIEHLQATGREVAPIAILNTVEARSFWQALGLEDGLGVEL